MKKIYLGKIGIVTNIVIISMLFMLGAFCFGGNNAYTVFSERQTQPYYRGCEDRNEVSLMINVYWGTEYIEDILQVLEQNQAKCTFFVGGTWVSDNKDMLKKIVEGGHEIGNHGYFHKDHKGMSIAQNRVEILNCNKIVKNVIGYDITLFAPPSGSFDKTTLKVASDLNLKVIMWSKDTIDWRDKNENLIYSRATKNVKAGDLILMHPTQYTLKALPTILKEYKKIGLKAVTVSQILKNEKISI